MGDEAADDPPTEYAPTEPAQLTEPSEAWSLVEDEPEPRWSPARITALAVGVSVVVVAAAAVVAVAHLSQRSIGSVAMVNPSVPATSRVPEVGPSGFEIPPPPPPTVTVTAPVPTHAPIDNSPIVRDGPSVEDYDQIFLSRLRAQNWVIWDERSITMNGHRVCALIGQGASMYDVQKDLVNQRVYPPTEASSFVATARSVYPECS